MPPSGGGSGVSSGGGVSGGRSFNADDSSRSDWRRRDDDNSRTDWRRKEDDGTRTDWRKENDGSRTEWRKKDEALEWRRGLSDAGRPQSKVDDGGEDLWKVGD